MNSLTALVAFLSVVALSALALSVFALFQSQLLLRAPARRGDPMPPRPDPVLDQMRASIEGLASQIRQLEGTPAAGDPTYRTGLNLTKRSQVLRMHRQGDPPAQIAAALSLPHQEVELLIKVQRIVLSQL